MIIIKNWATEMENADTRKRQRLGWFLAPTGTDSRGYRMLMRKGTEGIIALGVFQALCQVLGTLSKDARSRGELANSDGSGMEVADLWEMTRMDPADVQQAIKHLLEVGWLLTDDEALNPPSAGNLPPTCHLSATSVPKNSGFVKGEGEGEGEVPPNPQGGRRVKFQKPTIEEVADYGSTLNPPFDESPAFFDFYESKGWMVGKSPMKSWKAAVRNWQRNRTKADEPKKSTRTIL